ncbi:MAG: FtsQ-type POTRA domain-containing protein [Spirochaetales bacterium]|nr:FtsQ-type POTRA domain-containing protein [Spirochaetales bacterium]
MAEYAMGPSWAARDWARDETPDTKRRDASAYRAIGSGVRGSDRAGTRASRPRRSTGPGERGLQTVLAMLIIALLALSAAGLLLAPTMRVRSVRVEGALAPIASELAALAGLGDEPWLFAVDLEAVEASVASHPRVRNVDAERRLPSTVALSVETRVGVALALAELEGRTRAFLVDAEGVVFAEANQAEASTLPIVSGIRFEDFRFGVRLPAETLPLLEGLALLKAEAPELLAALSELRLVRRASGVFELLVYTMDYVTPARTGASLSGELLRSILLVLDVIEARGDADPDAELDFRTGTVVYRTKGGLPG